MTPNSQASPPPSGPAASYPSLRGRAVFITGGSSGIGADLVAAFASQGAAVSFTGRNPDAAAAVLQSCAGAAHT
ncbi:MAG: SDR family NAD(P)-dependent oxidoreductase, partial [Halothiobacillaceae bacterium]